jgi:hypothetical protein
MLAGVSLHLVATGVPQGGREDFFISLKNNDDSGRIQRPNRSIGDFPPIA